MYIALCVQHPLKTPRSQRALCQCGQRFTKANFRIWWIMDEEKPPPMSHFHSVLFCNLHLYSHPILYVTTSDHVFFCVPIATSDQKSTHFGFCSHFSSKQKILFLSNFVQKFLEIYVSEHLSFAKVIHPPDGCNFNTGEPGHNKRTL